MFKFSFIVDDNEDASLKCEETIPISQQISIECHECSEIFLKQIHIDALDVYEQHSDRFCVDAVDILHMKTGVLLKTSEILNQGNIGKAESCHSDLIPGVYEGGAKVWECTEDLIKYLDKNLAPNFLKGKSVLDLGCGTGILGVYAIKTGAPVVHFQDYNQDVLDNITIPTVLLNSSIRTLSDITENTKFYSGDWSKFIEATKNGPQFDAILTSETIYNPLNYKKLLDIFYQKLKLDGIVLLAAKIYYFGVGGSLREFKEFINQDGRFQFEDVWMSESGVSREILRIHRKR